MNTSIVPRADARPGTRTLCKPEHAHHHAVATWPTFVPVRVRLRAWLLAEGVVRDLRD